MSIEIDLTDIGGSRVFDVKECCEEEKCCPCTDSIECLQTQVGNLSLAMKTLLAVPMVKNILPEEELDKIDGLLGDD